MRIATILFVFLAVPSYADTLLCIGEQMAYITQDGDKLVRSGATDIPTVDLKYLVNETGVREFGEDDLIIESCTRHESGTFLCQGSHYLFQFMVMRNKTFRYVGISVNDDTGEYSYYIVMGKCDNI